MKITHIQAKEALINGEGIDKAWEIAQQDEGLLPETTKQDWVRWMSFLIENEFQSQTKALADPMHY